jgi:hypothetical protein
MNVRVCSCGCAFLACQAIGSPGKAAALLGKRDDQASGAFMTKAGSHAGLFISGGSHLAGRAQSLSHV